MNGKILRFDDVLEGLFTTLSLSPNQGCAILVPHGGGGVTIVTAVIMTRKGWVSDRALYKGFFFSDPLSLTPSLAAVIETVSLLVSCIIVHAGFFICKHTHSASKLPPKIVPFAYVLV